MLTTAVTGVLLTLLAWLGVEDAVYYAPILWVAVKVVVVAGVLALAAVHARRKLRRASPPAEEG